MLFYLWIKKSTGSPSHSLMEFLPLNHPQGRSGWGGALSPRLCPPGSGSIQVQTCQLLHSSFGCGGKLQVTHNESVHTWYGTKSLIPISLDEWALLCGFQDWTCAKLQMSAAEAADAVVVKAEAHTSGGGQSSDPQTIWRLQGQAKEILVLKDNIWTRSASHALRTVSVAFESTHLYSRQW